MSNKLASKKGNEIQEILGAGDKKLIDGHWAKVENVVARCHLRTHPGWLSKGLMASHDCIKKQCPFMKKVNPKYWKSVEKAIEKKRSDKKYKSDKERSALERNRLIVDIMENNSSIHVTAIKEEGISNLVIYYISDRKVDTHEELNLLKSRLDMGVRLKYVNAPDENIEALIRKPRREKMVVTDIRKAPLVGDATKKRLENIGIYCLEDLFGRSGKWIYQKDIRESGEKVNKAYLKRYISASKYAQTL
jgi:hypothetical protein